MVVERVARRLVEQHRPGDEIADDFNAGEMA